MRVGQLDARGEVRAEFLKRSGHSAGARNVVRMLADTEKKQLQDAETRRLKQQHRSRTLQHRQQQQRLQQQQQQPARPLPPQQRKPQASVLPPQEQRAPQRASQPASRPMPPQTARGGARPADDDDDEGLEIDFASAQPAPPRHSWEGMVRGAARKPAGPGPALPGAGASAAAASSVGSRVASGFFGISGEAMEEERELLQRHIGAVASGRCLNK